jgi:hypothetical protein
MSGRFVFVTIIILTLLIATPRAGATSIAFTLDTEGRIVVPLEIGGVENPCFILDTATRRFGLSNQMADRHWAERVFKGSINHISSGGAVRLPLAKLHRIRFGDHEIETGYAAIYPDRTAGGPVKCGMLGFDAYHGYVMRLEGPARRINLSANPGALARAGWRIITAEYNNQGALMIDTEYRGQTLTVMLATGLSHTMIDYAAAKLLFPEDFDGSPTARSKPHGTTLARMGFIAPEREYDTLMLPDLAVNGWPLGDVEAVVAHLPVRDQTGYMNAALLMIGADILARQDFALDTRAHQLWVPPAAGVQQTASQ